MQKIGFRAHAWAPQVNTYLNRQIKKYIKLVTCSPEQIKSKYAPPCPY